MRFSILFYSPPSLPHVHQLSPLLTGCTVEAQKQQQQRLRCSAVTRTERTERTVPYIK